LAAIVDVLGKGPEAHDLARQIDVYLERYGSADVAGLMTRLHQHLKGTRGAAIGLCAFETATGHIAYVGTGNTVARRFGQADTRLVSRDGVLGQNMRTPHAQTLTLAPGDLVVLHTDGVRDRFSSDDYPGMLTQAPNDVVRVLIDRFGKDYDDAACIAVRYES
jgi:serine phosphatase RsbU (regulator of sigma subunit)